MPHFCSRYVFLIPVGIRRPDCPSCSLRTTPLGDLNTYFALQPVNKIVGKFPLSDAFFHNKDSAVQFFHVSHGPLIDSVEIRCEELPPKDFRHFHISTIFLYNKL